MRSLLTLPHKDAPYNTSSCIFWATSCPWTTSKLFVNLAPSLQATRKLDTPTVSSLLPDSLRVLLRHRDYLHRYRSHNRSSRTRIWEWCRPCHCPSPPRRCLQQRRLRFDQQLHIWFVVSSVNAKYTQGLILAQYSVETVA